MSENTRIVKNATCTFCGCLCDDMDLTVDMDENRIIKAKRACTLGRAWFAEHVIEDRPAAMIDGKEVSFDEAVEEAAQVLTKAKFPIIYGLSDTTSEAQREWRYLSLTTCTALSIPQHQFVMGLLVWRSRGLAKAP